MRALLAGLLSRPEPTLPVAVARHRGRCAECHTPMNADFLAFGQTYFGLRCRPVCDKCIVREGE